MTALLSVQDLRIRFAARNKSVTAVDGISFDVHPGRVLAVVGESGCGKSVTSLSIMRILQGGTVSGKILFDGRNLLDLDEAQMCRVRGNEIAMIFQDPMTALNPTMSIGRQLMEPLQIHQGMGKQEAYEKACSMLKKVGISSPERRMKEFPHQLSGGMRQRVMIAIALACNPRLLIADEPTTALDVTIQAQILRLIRALQKDSGTAVMLITHDMGVVAQMADDVLVLYAGQAVEAGTAEDIFDRPLHPYTRGLLSSIPPISRDTERLSTIEGTVPSPEEMPKGCRFAPRCSCARKICFEKRPSDVHVNGRRVACHLYAEDQSHE